MLGARVMVVEDQPDIRRLLEHFITDAGGSVAAFDSGEAALKAVEQRPDDFDVILMDIQMPLLDGYETTRRLRALGFIRPIVAVTAGAMVGDQAKCLAAGGAQCDQEFAGDVRLRSAGRGHRAWGDSGCRRVSARLRFPRPQPAGYQRLRGVSSAEK